MSNCTNHQTLINEKWRSQLRTTGVQRYAMELSRTLQEIGYSFESASPMGCSSIRSTIWEQIALRRRAAQHDVLFCPANSGPMILSSNTRLVLTLHCLRFMREPESYSALFRAWYRFMIPKLVERADVLLTVSHTIAKEIEEQYPRSRGKLRVVYPGVGDEFRVENGQECTEDIDKTGEPYWVFIGNWSKAKNLDVLVRAMMNHSGNTRIKLIGLSQDELDRVFNRVPQCNGIKDQFEALGHVNCSKTVSRILRGSIGMLSPTLYESFNLPLAEAMASAVPVLISDLPVHREIGGEVPIFIDPHDECAWGMEMDRIVSEPQLAIEMGERGRERSMNYRWEVAGRALISIFEEGHERDE